MTNPFSLKPGNRKNAFTLITQCLAVREVRALQIGAADLDTINAEQPEMQTKYRDVFTGSRSTPKHKRRNLVTEVWL